MQHTENKKFPSKILKELIANVLQKICCCLRQKNGKCKNFFSELQKIMYIQSKKKAMEKNSTAFGYIK